MRKVLGISLQRLLSPRSSSGPCPTLMNLRCALFQFFCPLAPGCVQLAPLEPALCGLYFGFTACPLSVQPGISL